MKQSGITYKNKPVETLSKGELIEGFIELYGYIVKLNTAIDKLVNVMEGERK